MKTPTATCPAVNTPGSHLPFIHEWTGYRTCPACGKDVIVDFKGKIKWHKAA